MGISTFPHGDHYLKEKSKVEHQFEQYRFIVLSLSVIKQKPITFAMVALLSPIFIRSSLRSTTLARTVTSSWRRAPVNRHIILQENLFHIRHTLFQPETISNPASTENNSNVGSISKSTSPSSQISQDIDEMKHAAFLGEADSNDGHDVFRDAYAKRHEAMDGSNSAYLGEADSDDNYEIQRDIDGQKLDPLDAKNAAFLGEADSDDAFELDVIENPEAHEHKVDPEEAKNAAFLGESDSADMFEADREIHPESYSHHIEDTSTSGMHGEPDQ